MRDQENENAGNEYQIDGVPYMALEEPDLSWLRPYGTVFRVFDQQNSGNLCFGVEGRFGGARFVSTSRRERPVPSDEEVFVTPCFLFSAEAAALCLWPPFPLPSR